MIEFSADWLGRVAAQGDPKHSAGWHLDYRERCIRDFDEINQTVLPTGTRPTATRVMDIGCGFAGIDVILARCGVPDIHLIDGDGTGERNGGFAETMTPWRDVQLAADLVRDNASRCRVTTAAVPPEPEPWRADLIISLKSWGHHYGVPVYLDFVQRSLRQGGVLILDVRKGTPGAEQLQAAGFRLVRRAGGTEKTDRLVFCR